MSYFKIGIIGNSGKFYIIEKIDNSDKYLAT